MTTPNILYFAWINVAALFAAKLIDDGTPWVKDAMTDPKFKTLPRWFKFSTLYILILLVSLMWPPIILTAIMWTRK